MYASCVASLQETKVWPHCYDIEHVRTLRQLWPIELCVSFISECKIYIHLSDRLHLYIYSAAKMGLVGLAKTIAIEGAASNIHCNVIVPTAASRMTKDIMPEAIFNEMSTFECFRLRSPINPIFFYSEPSLIAPVVAFLCHETNEDNGGVIISAAGWATKTYLVQGRGASLRASVEDPVTPEYVRDSWHKVTDMSESTLCETSVDGLTNLMKVLDEMKTNKTEDQKQYSSEFVFGAKDLILYALGSGFLENDFFLSI